MNKTTEALKLALDALENCDAGDYSTGHVIHPSFNNKTVDEALAAIREALAEPVKQAPVGEVDLHKELGQLRWMGGDEGWDNAINAVMKRLEELYAAPVSAKHEWVDLTCQEITALIIEGAADGGWQGFAERVQAAYKDKNRE